MRGDTCVACERSTQPDGVRSSGVSTASAKIEPQSMPPVRPPPTTNTVPSGSGTVLWQVLAWCMDCQKGFHCGGEDVELKYSTVGVTTGGGPGSKPPVRITTSHPPGAGFGARKDDP